MFSLFLAASPSFAWAQVPEDVFTAARAAYEVGIEAWRTKVALAIRADKDLSVEAMDELMLAFQKRGEVPNTFVQLRSELGKLRAGLLEAYEAHAKAVPVTDQAGFSAIVAEKAVWRRIRDAVNWIETDEGELEELTGAAGSRDSQQRQSFELPVDSEGGYRLSLRGRRTGEGRVLLRLPRSKNVDALDLECTNDRFEVTVTVSPDGLVVVDGGQAAKVKAKSKDASSAASELSANGASPVLSCSAGSLRIERLRWKPFLIFDESVLPPPVEKAVEATVGAPFGRELVVNGGNERPLRTDGQIEGWNVSSGVWHRGNPGTQRFRGAYFSSSKVKGATPSTTAIYQDVDLRKFATAIDKGMVTADISFAQQSFPQKPADIGRVTVEFLDGDGKGLGGGYASGDVCNPGEWREVSGACPVPKGTRTARILLQSVRPRGAKGDSSDAHFDEVSLKLRKS